MMRKHILTAIQQHAEKEYPLECCGLVIKDGRRQRYIPCTNTVPPNEDVKLGPEYNFAICPHEYAAAEDIGEIIFIVHSHPNETSRPSPLDEALCEESGLPWVIISWPEGDVRIIAPTGDVPIIGRHFVHGVWDCYGLIRDWYKQERGIELPNFKRTDEWWLRGENLYRLHYAEAGFVAHKTLLQIGDVILMQYQAPEDNHAGIYMGDGLMLHHLYGQTSRLVPYGGVWQERTTLTLRHKSEIEHSND